MFVKPLEDFTIENAQLAFTDFSDKREFGIILPRETALRMKADGWNVEQTKAFGDDVVWSDFYIRIKIGKSKSNRLPKIELSNSRARSILQNEDELDNLDKIDIDKIDVTVFAYHWEVGESYGTSTYVKSLHITAKEDVSEVSQTVF